MSFCSFIQSMNKTFGSKSTHSSQDCKEVFNEAFTETVYGKGTKLWLGVPKKVLLKYVNPSFKEEIRRFVSSGNYGTTLFYSKDNSPKRYLLMKNFYIINQFFFRIF